MLTSASRVFCDNPERERDAEQHDAENQRDQQTRVVSRVKTFDVQIVPARRAFADDAGGLKATHESVIGIDLNFVERSRALRPGRADARKRLDDLALSLRGSGSNGTSGHASLRYRRVSEMPICV